MNGFALTIVLLCAPPSPEAFSANVRTTEPRSPEEQQQAFHVPDGFQVQLFASEPDLQKPMNMAFDARGRLWVTGSVEYPYAAAGDEGRDTIKILEDTDHDGRADKITTFVDGLNIPMGLYPYRDGVVAYSIPNIWFFRDTDGDGRADRREVLYGPLQQPRDTHGMQNAFRRGFDGWLYINHGFANETTLTGRDGSSIRLQSGNTYRVRLDGSRVEQVTWGQVNPFGSTFLADGDLITADCHSKPLTLLLRGAHYNSFGKPHDGLGFAPDLMSHDHGSTAICGVAQLTGRDLPDELRGQLVLGNVMTSRLNRDTLAYTGSSPRAVEQPDFLSCEDPWFRPVDLQIGPDGALYVADFYNRIIGHYEVPLEHPGRDKARSRIWRITYNRPASTRDPATADLAAADTAALIAALGSDHLAARMLAMDQLSDRVGLPAVRPLLDASANHSSEFGRVHALWTLHRLGQLPAEAITTAARDQDPLVRVHAFRVLAESPDWTDELAERTGQALVDDSPRVRRAAAEALGRSARPWVPELLAALQSTAHDDPFLRHALRIALREQLREPEAWARLKTARLAPDVRDLVARMSLGVPSADAATFLFESMRDAELDATQIEAQHSHLMVHLPHERLRELFEWERNALRDQPGLQAQLLLLAKQRLDQRGASADGELRPWAKETAERLLEKPVADQSWWVSSGDSSWGREPRKCADGREAIFLSSLPGGESKTSVLRSRTFRLPPRLTFQLCGHLGFPEKAPSDRNVVRLRSAPSGEVLFEARPPRSDVAILVDWDLASVAGEEGYLELTDGLSLDAYAWLAVSRFEPPVVSLPETSPPSLAARMSAASLLAVTFDLQELEEPLRGIANQPESEGSSRRAAAQAVGTLQRRPLVVAASSILGEGSLPQNLKQSIVAALDAGSKDRDRELLGVVLQTVSAREQRVVADAMAGRPEGAAALLDAVAQGQAAARLLQDPGIRQKLLASKIPDIESRMDAMTASLPPPDVELQRKIDAFTAQLRQSKGNLERGRIVFREKCAACHQVRSEGSLVGPQLDGIGNRGLERVVEDIYDPNRNVDAAFRVTVFSLADGRVITGLKRREEGDNLILVDPQGKEQAVRKGDVEEQVMTATSLMPANVETLLPPDDLRDLVSFLLTLRAAVESVP